MSHIRDDVLVMERVPLEQPDEGRTNTTPRQRWALRVCLRTHVCVCVSACLPACVCVGGGGGGVSGERRGAVWLKDGGYMGRDGDGAPHRVAGYSGKQKTFSLPQIGN